MAVISFIIQAHGSFSLFALTLPLGLVGFQNTKIFGFFFLLKWVADWGPEHRVSNLTVLCLLGPVRPLGGELQSRGLRPLCVGLKHGGSFVEEGVEQPARVPSSLYLVVMEWMAPLLVTVWVIPDFQDFLGFSLRRKILENRLPHGGNRNSNK